MSYTLTQQDIKAIQHGMFIAIAYADKLQSELIKQSVLDTARRLENIIIRTGSAQAPASYEEKETSDGLTMQRKAQPGGKPEESA